MKNIESVTYRVWDDFNEPVFVTRKLESRFDLLLSVYGEFPLLSRVKLTSGKKSTLQRYLDLLGRQAD